ncbi:MAG: bifunctional 5,10-methylenetetrahydrofolate dehydrogenase/5,10-methenyltetrahydrofolate cyclohydrolase, partial [Oscillospiraceae bacterium]|nr:bifunctional 5,10-methylenetetrahydrofolate dehydrogenase/5,10-methenyltetrahydrofolate cyclohydrolase [Oscillospiraceae bacterium]
ERAVKNALVPRKDVDGMTEGALGGIFTGSNTGFMPCTSEACLRILDYYGMDITGKNAVVIGRSLVIGKPLAMELLNRNATVTICHSKTVDLDKIVRRADYVFSAVGKRGVYKPSAFKEGQIVIDVGVNDNGEGGICGDIEYDTVREIVAAATPVPRGVGSVTTSVLASHVAEAAARSADRK